MLKILRMKLEDTGFYSPGQVLKFLFMRLMNRTISIEDILSRLSQSLFKVPEQLTVLAIMLQVFGHLAL
jgi:hypothetical protein